PQGQGDRRPDRRRGDPRGDALLAGVPQGQGIGWKWPSGSGFPASSFPCNRLGKPQGSHGRGEELPQGLQAQSSLSWGFSVGFGLGAVGRGGQGGNPGGVQPGGRTLSASLAIRCDRRRKSIAMSDSLLNRAARSSSDSCSQRAASSTNVRSTTSGL